MLDDACELLLVPTTTLNIYFVFVCMCVSAHVLLCHDGCVSQRAICGGQCSPFIMWDLGMEISFLNLAASALTS